MKRNLAVFAAAFLIVNLMLFAASGSNFIFDLSKGSAKFDYTTFGAYNPVQIQVFGEDGFAVAKIGSNKYISDSIIESKGRLNLNALATVRGIEIQGKKTSGEITYEIRTEKGLATKVSFTGKGDLTKSVNATSKKIENYDEHEIKISVYANADSGRLKIEDKVRQRDLAYEIHKKLPYSLDDAKKIVNEFGAHKASLGLNNAVKRMGGKTWGEPEKSAGAAGSVVNASTSINALHPSMIFYVSAKGPQYKGLIRSSQLLVRLFHPDDDELRLRDLEAMISILGPNKNLVLYDELLYDYQIGGYYYKLDGDEGWLINKDSIEPGKYALHIDIGRIQSWEVPVEITEYGNVFYYEKN